MEAEGRMVEESSPNPDTLLIGLGKEEISHILHSIVNCFKYFFNFIDGVYDVLVQLRERECVVRISMKLMTSKL